MREATSASLARSVIVGVALLWFALLFASLARWAWPLDLFTHFRLHYCVAFAVFAVLLLLLRRRAAAVVALLGMLVGVIPLLEAKSPQVSASSRAEVLRVVSFNIWFRNHDYARVAAYLQSVDPDVIVLQEAHGEAAGRMHALLPSHPYMHARGEWHGAVIFSKWPITAAASQTLAPRGASAARATIAWRDQSITVIGAHLHWPMGGGAARLRNQELAGLAALSRATNGPLLVVGDFNLTSWSPHFANLLVNSGLHDCAQDEMFSASWPSQTIWLGIRIDHCLASRRWRALDARIGPHLGSDHRPLIIELALEPADKMSASGQFRTNERFARPLQSARAVR